MQFKLPIFSKYLPTAAYNYNNAPNKLFNISDTRKKFKFEAPALSLNKRQ